MTSEKALPLADAPKDRTIRLLVEPIDGGESAYRGRLEDTREPTWTVGAWDEATESWLFAGWNWQHDCFCNGSGRVIGWGEWSATGTAP